MTIKDIESVFLRDEDVCELCEGTGILSDPLTGDTFECLHVKEMKAELQAESLD